MLAGKETVMSEQKRFSRLWAIFGLGLVVLLGLVAISGSALGSASATSVTATGAGPLMPAASSTPTCVPSWNVVSSPNVGSGHNMLYSTAAISPSDIWAVGSYRDASNSSRTLTMHWDGSAWS